jgi:hypothetical protein
VTVNGTDAFMEPISYVIKSAGSPIHCNDVAPPRYKMGGKWYCSYPELKECHDPEMLPVDKVRIDPVKVNDISLGKSIYTQEQLDKFARFQDSQGTRKAYLAETAEMAYSGRNERGEWGLALSTAAQGSLIDIVGADSPEGNLVPAGDITVQQDGRGHGGSWSPRWRDDGDQGNSGAGGGEAEEKEPEHGGPQEEVFVVAERGRQGGTACPPNRRGSRRRR